MFQAGHVAADFFAHLASGIVINAVVPKQIGREGFVFLSEKIPTEYIRSIRLKQSEKLLKTTNKTVQEIMFHCGFNNKAYFYREFAKKYHLTPKEYRNQK